jgi:hypothetical protein
VLVNCAVLAEYAAAGNYMLPLKASKVAVDGTEGPGEDSMQLGDHSGASILETVYLARE